MTQSNPPMSEAKTPEELAEKAADAHYNVTRLPGKGFHGQDAFEADGINALQRNSNYRPSYIQGYLAGYKQGSKDSAENTALISADLQEAIEVIKKAYSMMPSQVPPYEHAVWPEKTLREYLERVAAKHQGDAE